MIVVGLTGGMGQGKSTVGEMLRGLAKVDYKADLESSYPITEVANEWMETWPKPLKFPLDGNVINLANELIENLPPILQRITGKTAEVKALQIKNEEASFELHNRLIRYLVKWTLLSDHERVVQLPTPIDPDNKGLHRALFQWIGGVTVAVVSPTIWSDLLDHRIKQLSERGYKLVTVGGIRYSHDAEMIHANNGLVLRVARPNSDESSDVTEISMNHIMPDAQLYNDGSLEQLEKVVRGLWRDLQTGETKPEYQASEA